MSDCNDAKEFVIITDIVDRGGYVVAKGLHEKLKVEKKCIYCDHFEDPEFNDPRYPQGAGFCSLCYSFRDMPSLAYFDNTCDKFKPNERSSGWLHSDYMAGQHQRVHVWWNTYPDREGLERLRKQNQKETLLEGNSPTIDVELRLVWSTEKPLWFSPDGRFIAESCMSISDKSRVVTSILVWDVSTKKRKLVFELPSSDPGRGNPEDEREIVGVFFNPDNRLLAIRETYSSFSWDRRGLKRPVGRGCETTVWDLGTGQKVGDGHVLLGKIISTTSGRYFVAFDPK